MYHQHRIIHGIRKISSIYLSGNIKGEDNNEKENDYIDFFNRYIVDRIHSGSNHLISHITDTLDKSEDSRDKEDHPMYFITKAINDSCATAKAIGCVETDSICDTVVQIWHEDTREWENIKRQR